METTTAFKDGPITEELELPARVDKVIEAARTENFSGPEARSGPAQHHLMPAVRSMLRRLSYN